VRPSIYQLYLYFGWLYRQIVLLRLMMMKILCKFDQALTVTAVR